MRTIEIIKAKLREVSTEQLISVAKTARANKQDETQRMICAGATDVIEERVSEIEFEKIFEDIFGK